MAGSKTVSERDAIKTSQAIYAAIAEKVRGDSQDRNRVTPVEALGNLFPEMTPEQVINHLGEMVKVDEYEDVKLITSANSWTYLYSDTSISPEQANEKILAEETQGKIASKVREDSQARVQLTPVAVLSELVPDVPSERIEAYTAAMADDVRYQDVKSLRGPTGVEYLYSENHMTANYATLLARVETKDPHITIAETVREESRIYPRPTRVALFYEPVFQIEPVSMGTAVESIFGCEEYQDIKKIVASTGTIYLYSDRYMSAPQAEHWVQWQEVDKWNSQ